MNGRSIGKIFLQLAVLAIVTGVTFAGGKAESGKILIGCIQDLSGPTSVWGNAVKKGAEVAIDKINTAGGIDGKLLELKAYDVKGDPQEAINAYTRLADQDKAVAVIGPPISNIGLAVANLSEAKKVPIVGSFIDPRVTVKQDGNPAPYMFLMQPSSVQYAEIIADYALTKLSLKNAAVFYDQSNAFAVSQVKPFMAHWEKNGGKITVEQVYKKGDKDFKTQLSKIKDSGADCIYAPNYLQDLVLTLQQADQIGLKVPIVGGLDFAPPFTTLLSDPKLADKIYFANNYSDAEPQLAEVREAYKKKYNEEPVNKVYLGYDKMLIIADAIKRAKSIDPVAVRAAIEQTKNLQGTTGVLTISPKNHQPVGLSMVMYAIEQGKYRDLGRHVPESHK
jgi:branched-chain amino acid transport system substrate-binding protein